MGGGGGREIRGHEIRLNAKSVILRFMSELQDCFMRCITKMSVGEKYLYYINVLTSPFSKTNFKTL